MLWESIHSPYPWGIVPVTLSAGPVHKHASADINESSKMNVLAPVAHPVASSFVQVVLDFGGINSLDAPFKQEFKPATITLVVKDTGYSFKYNAPTEGFKDVLRGIISGHIFANLPEAIRSTSRGIGYFKNKGVSKGNLISIVESMIHKAGMHYEIKAVTALESKIDALKMIQQNRESNGAVFKNKTIEFISSNYITINKDIEKLLAAREGQEPSADGFSVASFSDTKDRETLSITRVRIPMHEYNTELYLDLGTTDGASVKEMVDRVLNGFEASTVDHWLAGAISTPNTKRAGQLNLEARLPVALEILNLIRAKASRELIHVGKSSINWSRRSVSGREWVEFNQIYHRCVKTENYAALTRLLEGAFAARGLEGPAVMSGV